VLRYIPSEIPRLDELRLPSVFKDLALSRRGLVLVVGAAGSGKSTSIASMIDYRNELQTGHILTFEDPIEYLFQNKKSIINQREIGTDASSLQTAMRSAMRQAPDVMFIGEIRDRETMAAALAYAMSGHFLIATMHATNSANALNRIINFYTPETRAALFEDVATSLRAIICQRLVRSRRGGRVPTVEVLTNTGHTRDLIIRGDVSGIKEALAESLVPENQSFEQSLYGLLKSDEITRDDALASADSQNNLLWFINNAGKARTESSSSGSQGGEGGSASFTEITLNI